LAASTVSARSMTRAMVCAGVAPATPSQ
jgi:hypothetical protein